MLRRVRVGKLERGFLFKNKDYVRYLEPGSHWLWGFGLRASVKAVTDVALHGDDLEVIAKDKAVSQDLEAVDLHDHERALVWVDGRLRCVLVPGRAAFWKVLREVKVEVVDARAIRFEHAALTQALAVPGGREALDEVTIPPGMTGLLLVDEKVREELGPGKHALWKGIAAARIVVVDRREQALEVGGQELLTKDKATIRVNIVASFKVSQPKLWTETSQNASGTIYRDVQLAARVAVGARTLDEVVSAKETIASELLASVAPKAEVLGASIISIGVKDVILPGEMRALMNQVLEAEKRAQANFIARREETAAVRALVNTAKLYAENPTLLRLKELETAEKIAEKVAELRVSGVDELLARMLPRAQG